MTLEERIRYVREHYPDQMTQKEFAAALGVGISSAYRLNRKGIVPYEEIRDGFHHYYSIEKEDVLSYLKSRYAHEESSFREEADHEVRKLLSREQEVLSVKDVMRITGVCKSAASKWITFGKIKGFRYMNKLCVLKEDLIAFMASPLYLDSSHRNEKAECLAERVTQNLQSRSEESKIAEEALK